MKRPDRCICLHPDAAECYRRRQLRDGERDDLDGRCERCCHSRDEDGFR